MTYEAFEEKISAYLDDELNSVERAEMERKASECGDCRALLKDLKALKERLARLPQAQPSAGFNFALRSHLLMHLTKESQTSHRVRRVFFGSAVRTIATMAAAIVFGFGLTRVVQDRIASSPSVQTAVEDTEFPLTPAQTTIAADHRGALERLSQQSHRLDGKLYRDNQDSGQVDTMLNRQKGLSPWLQNQRVKQVPVSF
jgi:anti-sigma factor RsiW